MSEIVDAFNFLDLEEVDSVEIKNLCEYLQQEKKDEEKEVIVSPTSKIAARSWALAYAHLDQKLDFYDEYKKNLHDRYISPVEREIESINKSQEMIKLGMLHFLENAEEKNVKFPDIGTFSLFNPSEGISYPEDEEETVNNILVEKDEEKIKFIKAKYSFDKEKIKEYFKEQKKLPLEELEIKKKDKTVRFNKAKNVKM